MNQPAFRPLPVSATFVMAYHLVWYNRWLLLKGAALPIVALAVSIAMVTRIVYGVQTPDQMKTVLEGIPQRTLFAIAFAEVTGVWTLLAFSVSWRRYLLHLGPGVDFFYFRMPFWRYVFSIFVAGLVFLAGMFVLNGFADGFLSRFDPSLKTGNGVPAPSIQAIAEAVLVATLAGFTGLLARHVLIFTQVLTNDPEASFRPLRAAMKGNVLRLVAIWLLTVCTTIGTVEIVTIPLRFLNPGNFTVMLVSAAIASFTFVLLAALMSAVAALVYDYLVHGGGPQPPAA